MGYSRLLGKVGVVCATVIGVLAAGDRAEAGYYYTSAQACAPALGGPEYFYLKGAENDDPVNTNLYDCPATGIPSLAPYYNVNRSRVYYDDETTTGHFSCRTVYVNASGSGSTAFKYSCATLGGCDTSVNSYVGTNWIEWSDPFGTGNVWAYGLFVQCYVPAKSSTTSAVWGYVFELV